MKYASNTFELSRTNVSTDCLTAAKRKLQRTYFPVWKPSIGEKLVAKREFNNPMDKHAVKVVKGNETVGHLPSEVSQIAWYFLARNGGISVKAYTRVFTVYIPYIPLSRNGITQVYKEKVNRKYTI